MRSTWLTLLSISLLLPTLPVAVLPPALAESESTCEDADCFLDRGRQEYKVGQLEKAVESFQQALLYYQQDQDREGEADALNNLGETYRNLNQYVQALATLEQAVAVMRTLEDHCRRRPRQLELPCNARRGEAASLYNLSLVYKDLGQSQQAAELFEQAREIEPELGGLQSGVLVALGGQKYDYSPLYLSFEAYGDLDCVSSNRALRRIVGEDLELESLLAAFNPELQTIGSRQHAAILFNGRGRIYEYKGYCEEALIEYQQALAISLGMGDRAGESYARSNIGRILEKQNQPELAIAFYKRAVNIQEAIREDNQELPLNLQRSYLSTVASTYRVLADLLLQQNRILEAQRVLDLLKVQELEDYLQDVRGTANSATGTPERPAEQAILQQTDAQLTESIALNQRLSQLYQIPDRQRTPEQRREIIELDRRQRELSQQFGDFLSDKAIQQRLEELRKATGGEMLNLSSWRDLQNNLRALNQNAVLLYPFVLEDRLELILLTSETTPVRVTVPVTRTELNRAIANFRAALENPSLDAVTPARQLYGWLIQPLETALGEVKAQTILYAPDGQLRYIPLAALHDGNQWLAQRFRINNITAASIDDLNLAPRRDPTVFAGAFTEGNVSVQLGNRQIPYSGLPFAGREVANLAKLLPNTSQFLNQSFNPDSVALMNGYSIVHLATHAEFDTDGRPESSFILFGDGEIATLRQIDLWNLTNVDLVVLSACETGVGDVLGDGVEILGFGYQMQKSGAQAAIASLWSVNDGGTQMLMDAFYQALKAGYSKTESLQRAQQALITGDMTAVGAPRGSATIEVISRETGLSPQVSSNLDHPYYWAPFILIGNGL